MAPPPPSEPSTENAETGTAADGSAESSKKSGGGGNAASASREAFLQRLEQKQQQEEQLKSPPEEVEEVLKVKAAPTAAEKADVEENAVSSESETKPKQPVQTMAKPEENVPAKKDTASGNTNANGNTTNSGQAATKTPTPQQEDQKQSVGDRLLIDYLSKYCDAATSSSGGEGAASSSVSSPSDWIQDVDPSSLALLKGLAGIPGGNYNSGAAAAAMNMRNVNSGPNMAMGNMKSDLSGSDLPSRSGSASSGTPAILTSLENEPTKAYEVYVPSDAVPGEPFSLMASGVRVRVMCPKGATPGSKVRFNLPLSLFDQSKQQPPPVPVPPPAAQNWWRGGMGATGSFHVPLGDTTNATSSKQTPVKEPGSDPKPSASSSTSTSDEDNNNSLQHRMLNIIERQQTQMHEMQARLDALGGMMAQMEQDMRYLRNNHQPGWGPQPTHPGYRMLGGLFGGSGAAQPGGGAQPGFGPWQGLPGTQPGQWQWPGQQGGSLQEREVLPEAEQTASDHELPVATMGSSRGQRDQRQQARQQEQQAGPPAAARREQRPPPLQPQPQGAAPPRNEQVVIVNQGIFFPLFAMLFRFLFSLPGRLRSLLLSTGIGRVYAHLRQRAIDRNAFANVDLSSIMKLLVMLLIFSGRMGDRASNNEGRNARNNNNRRNAAAAENDEEFGMMEYAHQLLQYVIDYWNGHRVHTLVLASLIGFLIQVGLMSFLYEVLWVERGDLFRAWLGQDEEHADNLDAGDGNGQGAVAANGNRVQGDLGNNNNGDRAAAAPAPRPQNPAAAGGMIRRGPENGGIFHDIQCLILSFLLSLIPAWRPEEAAQPVEEPQQEADTPQLEPEEEGQAAAAAAPEPDQQDVQGDGGDEIAAE